MPRVLFLSSYSYAFFTVPEQIAGVRSVLAGETEIDYEFLDTKRFPDHDILPRQATLLRYKFAAGKPYNLVLAGDDAALAFVQCYRKEFFSGLPIVFHGINDLPRAKAAAQDPLITGVAEHLSLQDTMDIARKLWPQATRAVAIVDDSLTGDADRRMFYSMAGQTPQLHFTEINTSLLTLEELRQRIRALGRQDLVFFLTFSEDAQGNTYSLEDGAELIRSYATVPVFRMVPDGIGHGFVGGRVLSHYDSGRLAATMARRILRGESPADIAMVADMPTRYIFDYLQLQHLGLDTDLLPPDTAFIGFQPSFFAKNRQIVLPSLCVIAILICLSFFFWQDNRRQRRLAANLSASRQRLLHRVHHDNLTGLLSRASFIGTMAELLKNGIPCAVVTIDLDNFKQINDQLGHDAGDRVLREAASRLSAQHSDLCTAYRYGGDEFMLILRTVDTNEINRILTALQISLRQPFDIGEQKNALSASMGVALAPADSRRMRDLLAFADAAMYRIKRNGKNGWCYYGSLRQVDAMEEDDIPDSPQT